MSRSIDLNKSTKRGSDILSSSDNSKSPSKPPVNKTTVPLHNRKRTALTRSNQVSSASLSPTNKRQAIHIEYVIDPDKELLLSALDSYHDFGGSRSCLKSHYVRDLINRFLNKKVQKEFLEFTKNKEVNGKKIEHRVFEKFVTENHSFLYRKEKVHFGTVAIDPVDVFKYIKEFYLLDENNVLIINDSSSLIGCNNSFKYRVSYASWLDKSGCNKDHNTDILYNKLTLEKSSNSLLYIDKIDGCINRMEKAEGKIFVGNKEVEFNEDSNNDDRPEVNTYSSYITDITNTTFLDKFLRNTRVYESSMFLMDLKRAGDGLQIVSAKQNGNLKIPIFITGDLIAATISINKGVRTILTTKDAYPVDGNLHSFKYITMLVPITLLNPDVIKERIKKGLQESKISQQDDWGVYANEVIEKLNKISNDSDNIIEIVSLLSMIQHFYSIENEIDRIYDRFDLQIKNYIVLSQQYKIYSDADLVEIDYKPFKEAFDRIYKEKDTLNIIAKLKKHLFNILKDDIHIIDEYAKTYKEGIMTKYLSYVTNIIKESNIDTYDFSLIGILYTEIKRISEKITAFKEFDTLTHKPWGRRDLLHLNHFGKHLSFAKNLNIALHIRTIFRADEIKYKTFIGNLNAVSDNNIVINSPIGAVYIEYLLTLTDEDSKTSLINSINSTMLLDTSEKQRFIIHDKITVHINPYVHNYLYNTPSQNDKDKLYELKQRIVAKHIAYIGLVSSSSSSFMGGRKQNQYTSSKISFSLPKFMELPFNIKKKVLKESSQEMQNIILEKIYKKYYNSKNYVDTEVLYELSLLKELKKMTQKRSGGIRVHSLIPGSSKIHNLNAFRLFKEYALNLYPEYIDPVMMTYMDYSNSIMPL